MGTITPTWKTSFPWLDALPLGWKQDRLKNLVPRIVGGGTPKSSNPDFWGGDIIWVTPTDFSRTTGSDEIELSERTITNEGLQSCSATMVPRGAIIMASRATIGSVRVAGTDLATNQGFISFVCNENVLHSKFLFYVIEGYLGDYFFEVAPRTTFAEISRGRAKQVTISYPEKIEDQMVIAKYLDLCCASVDEVVPRRATSQGLLPENDIISCQINSLARYRKSLIRECVTGKRRITEDDLKDVI